MKDCELAATVSQSFLVSYDFTDRFYHNLYTAD